MFTLWSDELVMKTLHNSCKVSVWCEGWLIYFIVKCFHFPMILKGKGDLPLGEWVPNLGGEL